MQLDRRALLLALAAVGTAGNASADVARGSLDGDWEGDLTSISGPGLAPPAQDFGRLRLHIDLRNVRVYAGQEEVKPGTFMIERADTNAVITSIQPDPGAPLGSSWVETWTFVVALADADSLVVNYVRMVKNNGVPPTADGAYFSQVRTGQFHRVRSDVR